MHIQMCIQVSAMSLPVPFGTHCVRMIIFMRKHDMFHAQTTNFYPCTNLNGTVHFENVQDSLSITVKYVYEMWDNKFEKFHGSSEFKSRKIKEVKVTFGESEYLVDSSVFNNLFQVWAINNDEFGLSRPIELYSSINKKLLYLYVYGGGESSFYLAKLVFSKKGFEAKIVLDYFDFVISGGIPFRYIGI